MDRGHKSLRAAKTLLREALYEDAVSRAYYAVLHATKAALLTLDLSPETHRGARQMFHLHLVKSGLIEREYGEILIAEQEDRETCDYTITVEMSKEDATRRVEEAERFLARSEKYLKATAIGGVRPGGKK